MMILMLKMRSRLTPESRMSQIRHSLTHLLRLRR